MAECWQHIALSLWVPNHELQYRCPELTTHTSLLFIVQFPEEWCTCIRYSSGRKVKRSPACHQCEHIWGCDGDNLPSSSIATTWMLWPSQCAEFVYIFLLVATSHRPLKLLQYSERGYFTSPVLRLVHCCQGYIVLQPLLGPNQSELLRPFHIRIELLSEL